MHAGSIHNQTKAGRLYRYMRERQGEFMDSWQLTCATATTAISTRISEIRSQLPPGERIEAQQRGQRWYYRIVLEDSQC